MRPTLRGVAEIVDHALLDAGLLVLVLQRQLRVLDLALQAHVARQPDDVVHARALAPIDDLPAKRRVASEHDAHVEPRFTQPAHQQLENRRCVLRAIDAAGPQVGAQQLLAAEHVQRQVAVAVVVAVEEVKLPRFRGHFSNQREGVRDA